VPTLIVAGAIWSLLGSLIPSAFPPALRSFLGVLFVLFLSIAAGRWFGTHRASPVRHLRGARLSAAPAAPTSPVPDAAAACVPGSPPEPATRPLTLAGVPIPREDETKHFKLLGTTGTGKSTAIRELIAGALARGDRAVIADPDGGYLRRFHDSARGDQILSPYDARAARWDLLAELQGSGDADALARAFIPDHEGSERSWRAYARVLVASLLRQLQRGAPDEPLVHLYHQLFLAPIEELRELLDATPAAPYLATESVKFFESVRSVAATHFAALEPLARQSSGAPLAVRRWIREGRGVLFLPYRASQITTLHQLISAWMRLAIFETMDRDEVEQPGARLWFVLDELDALGAIDGLKDALARLRKFGAACILGLQSIAQVRGTYGDPEAQTIVENCGNTLILRCSASERGGTAEFASRLIGRREIVRQVQSISRSTRLGGSAHQSRTRSEQYVTEDAVMASEIEQLPDRTGYLKLASRPAWMAVQFPVQDWPKIAESYVPVTNAESPGVTPDITPVGPLAVPDSLRDGAMIGPSGG
ncbi:MAG TPA: type IV secretion system DNA-binding domain-containing protein, partial [Steroidobacteraceae bacterium]|nr:type IV secretion system DNA-binding domain-containing protein [Steroidobacteraceae bacterium]